ncbi:hypothetical protein DYB30_012189 [Aphanomyces astaci]|nr:hypothetical protein DYB30_012189 [Aphanomyces astaci]RHY58167.1 hypothetical protein DYB34_013751 [Aphanomyces astaci]RHZ08906.1 hypothetical protein DYB31_014990 [Aphanomyces astaci]RHZ16304.1 hypothetical protein DYB26_006684 [Aphanomyces astaci]
MVKETVGQRNTSAVRLATFVCGGASWSEIKTKIFVKFKGKCLGLAARDDNGAWTIIDEPLNETYFARMFSLRSGSHVRRLDNDSSMGDWLTAMRSTRVGLSIYKYGNSVATKEQLLEFTAVCVVPGVQDRGGAPSEETIQQYIAKLREKWQETWEGDRPIWRIWAGHVLRPPVLAWDSRIQHQPPSHVLARLRPRTLAHDVRMESMGRTIRTAMDVVDASMLELGQIRGSVDVVLRAVEIVNQRLALFEQALAAKRETLVAMGQDLAPIPDNELPVAGLHAVENVRDTDHDFALEDME